MSEIEQLREELAAAHLVIGQTQKALENIRLFRFDFAIDRI